jgi:hypothetical protein
MKDRFRACEQKVDWDMVPTSVTDPTMVRRSIVSSPDCIFDLGARVRVPKFERAVLMRVKLPEAPNFLH